MDGGRLAIEWGLEVGSVLGFEELSFNKGIRWSGSRPGLSGMKPSQLKFELGQEQNGYFFGSVLGRKYVLMFTHIN